jgi:hypothetical protein
MLTLTLFLLCLSLTGVAATAWLWSLDSDADAGGAPGLLEGLASAILVTTSLWVATNWALAPLHAIHPPLLLAASIALALASAVFLRRQARASGAAYATLTRVASSPSGLTVLSAIAIVLPMALWIAFVAWRSTITLGLNYDGLSYHLPRAVDIVQTGTWRYLPVEDFRLAWFPANYEMMLADVLAFTGSDALTPLVSIWQYVAGVAVCAAWGERRWGSGARAWIGALAWASTPLALLHSGHVKNDVLTMVCTVSVALWGARWVTRGGTAPFVLALVAAAMGVGTKPTGGFAAPAIFVAFVPFGLFRQLRATLPSAKQVAAFVAGSAALLCLLGIAPFAAHLAHPHVATDLGMTPAEMARTNITPSYSGWNNLWRFPILAWLRAFDGSTHLVYAPWAHAGWYWPKYELYFADFGAMVSCLALLLPVAAAFALASRRRPTAAISSAREHAAASLFLVATFVTTLMMQYRIDGAFNSFGRYVLFVPLLVVDWGLLPLIDRLRTSRARVVTAVVIAAQASFFVFEGFAIGEHDEFASGNYLRSLLLPPERRLVQSGFFPRAAQVLDGAAGPHDRVLIDGDFGAWIYPAYGRDRTRAVEVAPLQAEARARAVDRADWVAIDRFWAICWGADSFLDMGHPLSFETGKPTPREVEFYVQMTDDPRFVVFFADYKHGQVVFRRVVPRG